MFYGLDVHKRFMQVYRLATEGEEAGRFRVETTREGLEAFAKTLGPDDAVVLETTFHTWEIASLLRPSGARVVVANSLEVKAIAHARIKTDKIDAAILARLLRAGFIPEVELPDAITWAQRKLISHRRLLVKQRTATKNAIRSLLNQRLLNVSGCDPFTRAGRQALEALDLDDLDRFLVDNHLALLDALEAAISAADERLRQCACDHEAIRLLMTIPGVGLTVAVGLVAAIGDVRRFPDPGRLASYLGLVPSTYQSGASCYHGSITKKGSSSARHLAIEAAQILARTDTPLAATYHRLRRARPHNIAVTALARKLIRVVWHVLKRRQPYRYAPAASTREKLRRVSPDRRPRRPVPRTLAAVYAEAQLPAVSPASPAEHRTARSNRAILRRARVDTDS